MIDILKEKHVVMKSEPSLQKDAALIVLNEIRTIEMLERGEITSKMQHKWFEKMLANRNTAANIYKQQKREDLYEKENAEAEVIKNYMKILENDMPKQLTEDEVKKIVIDLIHNHIDYKIGDIMKHFAVVYPDQNKAMVSKIYQEIKRG